VASIGTWFVPGGAGIALGMIDMNDEFASRLRDMSAAELQIENRAILDSIGCDQQLTDSFIKRPGYTAAHASAICHSLRNMANVRGACQFLNLLPEWPGPEGALFCQTQIQMAAAYHRKVEQLSTMRIAAETPVFETVDGKIFVFLPLDHIYWNAGIAEQLRAIAPLVPQGARLIITGTATERAKAESAALGFYIQENSVGLLWPRGK
jgi:hypothetical protein